MVADPPPPRLLRLAAIFLAVSYVLGAPATAFLEFDRQALSQRFDLPSALIYVTCAAQLVCGIGVLVRRVAPWAAAALTVTTIGAIASHLRIGAPTTAVPALIYTAIQIWFGLESRRASSEQ